MSGRQRGSGRSGGPEPLSLDNAPAADQDAERAVLGGLLLYSDPRLALRLKGRGLTPEAFYWPQYGAVYQAILSLANQQIGMDPVTTYAEAERLGIHEGLSKTKLDMLTGYVPSAGNISAYADRVIEQAHWRERRRVALKMLEAISAKDQAAWEATTAVFAPPPEAAPAPSPSRRSGPTTLRLVDQNGEIVEEQQVCQDCQDKDDQLKGAQREIAGWRTRYAKLERDKEREARNNALWLPAQALFEHWKTLTGHKNSKWTADRFYVCEPLLKKYNVEIFERAIAGIAYNPYTKARRNGSIQKFDSWETLCKGAGQFEEYANRAPKGWKVTLRLSVETREEAPAASQPQLRVAAEAS